ncbi:hypothetical protein [Streptomyces sp. NPDC056361]|uniref:hypothetical protein n=1 Tax=Streptomyces sp. NPDC056361 TaxID=3345795 RepID=UPI0035D7E88A
MSARGEVFLGDLVRATAGLRATDAETVAAIAGLLGLGPGVPALAPSPATDRPSPAARSVGPVRTADGAGVGAEGLHVGRAPAVRAKPVPDRPTDVSPTPRRAPTPGRTAQRADRPVDFSLTAHDGFSARGAASAGVEDSAVPTGPEAGLLRRHTVTTALRHEPPWKPGWARGVMFGAVAMPAESTVCDQAALLRGVARQKALVTIPRRRRLTTRRGAQLLLDHGKAMVPFQDDRIWLSDLLGSIAGRDRVEVLRFRGTPRRGVVRDDPLARDPYRAPAPGTPVVLFSDLGRMRPPFSGSTVAGTDEWHAFVDSVVHTGCPIVCLTPYQPYEYPETLRRTVAFVPLTRDMSIRRAQEATARVRRALGQS